MTFPAIRACGNIVAGSDQHRQVCVCMLTAAPLRSAVMKRSAHAEPPSLSVKYAGTFIGNAEFWHAPLDLQDHCRSAPIVLRLLGTPPEGASEALKTLGGPCHPPFVPIPEWIRLPTEHGSQLLLLGLHMVAYNHKFIHTDTSSWCSALTRTRCHDCTQARVLNLHK
jgi:hypothetical protein